MRSEIMVATDFSPRSDRALRRATMLARQFGLPLRLVNVVDDDQPRYLIDVQLKASDVVLRECIDTLARIDGIDARAEVVAGDVFSGLLQVADRVDPALIVMGPHRRQLRNAFVGTTAERTIARSRHPVLMVAGVPSAPYAKILIALDMDEASKAAARHAATLPVVDRSTLVALHVFDAPAEGMMELGMATPDAIDHYVAGEKRRADRAFGAMLEEIGAGTVARMLVPLNGRAAQSILDAARTVNAALVIVGTSQKRGLKRFLLGSAAEEILAGADRDILVIPRTCGGGEDQR